MALNLREGLGALLDMHHPAELGALCGALGLVRECEFGTCAEKKIGIVKYIADEGKKSTSQAAHAAALVLM